MAFLQKRLCDSTKFQAHSLRSQSGFLVPGLLSLLSLMFLTLIGFSLISVGIKNSTQAQSYCLKELSRTQKQLGEKLQQLLMLNKKVRALDSSRKSIDAAIAAATASIFLIPKVPALEKAKKLVQLGQKVLIASQKGILIQSQLIKKKQITKLRSQLTNLKGKFVLESSFYKKALAVEKEKIGDKAYIYKPVQEFKKQQKIKVLWSLPAFYSLQQDLSWIMDRSPWGLNLKPSTGAFFIKQSCAVTLERKGEQWVYRLSY